MDSLPFFDGKRHVLGSLCSRKHDWQGTGKSLRYRSNRDCVSCLSLRDQSKTNPKIRRDLHCQNVKHWMALQALAPKPKSATLANPLITPLIPLTRGFYARVDREDYPDLIKTRWHLNSRGYAVTTSHPKNTKLVAMHRVILCAANGQIVDHKDGDRLNNARRNLRICSVAQNNMNSAKPKNSRSRFKGLSWDSKRRFWRVKVQCDGKTHEIGQFTDELEAAKAYNVAALRIQGEFARVNDL